MITGKQVADIEKELDKRTEKLDIGQEYFALTDKRSKIAQDQYKEKQEDLRKEYELTKKSLERERDILISQGKLTDFEQTRIKNEQTENHQKFINDNIKLYIEHVDKMAGYMEREKKDQLAAVDAREDFAKRYISILEEANIEITQKMYDRAAILMKSIPIKDQEEYLDRFKEEANAHKENLEKMKDIEEEKRKAFKDTYKLFIRLTTEALKVYDDFLEAGKIKGIGKLAGGVIGLGLSLTGILPVDPVTALSRRFTSGVRTWTYIKQGFRSGDFS